MLTSLGYIICYLDIRTIAQGVKTIEITKIKPTNSA